MPQRCRVTGKSDPLGTGLRKWAMRFEAETIIRSEIDGLAAPVVRQDNGDGRSQVRAHVTIERPQTDWTALVLRVRDHQDQAAFADLFRHFAPRVKAFLMKSGTPAALAEECAQDVMATLWQKAHQFDPARAAVSTWVYTIARNRRIDLLRKSLRVEPEELDWGTDQGHEPDQADVYAAKEETRALTQALSLLPVKQRALIERAYYGDLSHSELAAETGLPLGTIKSRIRLALDRLRQVMQ
jgi:RNA polymerase sigma factor (sigma-70 family)